MHPQRRLIPLRWLAMGLCLLAVLALAWNGLRDQGQRRVDDAQQDADLQLQAESLLQTAQGLEAIRHGPAAPDLNALFAVQAPVPAAPVRPAPRAVMPMTVDMIIAAGDQGRAIVSGRLTRIGDTLPDGSRVKDIRADGVFLQLDGQVRRLPAPRGRRTAQENGS